MAYSVVEVTRHAGTPGRPGRRRRHLGHLCRLPPAAAPAGARVRGV